MFKSSTKVVFFLSVKFHSGEFEADRYDFLISMINKNKIKLHFTLKSDNPNEPIYFVKVIVKRAASENHSVPYGHFI